MDIDGTAFQVVSAPFSGTPPGHPFDKHLLSDLLTFFCAGMCNDIVKLVIQGRGIGAPMQFKQYILETGDVVCCLILSGHNVLLQRVETFVGSQGLPGNKFDNSGSRMAYPARRDDESYRWYGEQEQRCRDVKIVARMTKLILDKPQV
jgi:hypothetical protein